MRIADSVVNMISGRNYNQAGLRAGIGYASDFVGRFNSYSMKKNTSSVKDTYQKSIENGMMSSYNMDDIGYFKKLGKIASSSLFDANPGATNFQNNTLETLFRRFSAYGMMGGGMLNVGHSMDMIRYYETEETSFHADGKACTEDGRTIDFNVNILMSRSYMEYMNVNIPTLADALCDPLVVNIGLDTVDVSDQTFKFDIDADGNDDEISMLGNGSGFLALDKDGNGKINDGSELFGAKSGDGFQDLREYDSDGNGWIDENDEIFSKLKVWCKDKNGKDILMDLKAADIGAIYLGEQKTEFSLGGLDGFRDGVIRSTGVFLRESGIAGTIQHVDLSMKQNGLGIKVSGDSTVTDNSFSSNRIRQSTASRRRAEKKNEEKRRLEARKMKKKAEEKAMLKRRLEHKEFLDKILN